MRPAGIDTAHSALKEIAASKNPEDSKLHLELAGRDPDLALSDVAYVKGAFFFKTLEQKVGRAAGRVEGKRPSILERADPSSGRGGPE